ncbi:YidC/Oxa1 family membrane protein insertase [Thermosediminibacter oceani]|uniref:Membrane protein insertase, YidC/Oxa1 family n=1 Tax=Thermosediminibacter oceani (strain ATCC BAA-1034 / DSM 16646 / JW/IW-1228P) TaxID=555079 RepID=D9S1B2_THEOJ|nr:YidC/Oxa1 family membrane protein insertase [Thermosediminibacter oceani]ADL08991.1 membrane protein insertase, YidC/Oxa1 family [Thermosediminibacter oceani DSM 16646]
MALLEGVLKQILDFLFLYTKSYGVAIIVLTALIKLVLLPFSFQQFQSIKKMQEIAPLQKKLQEKYKNDKEKLNRELLKLYQENKVNPMGGCLPLLIQFPFIIALFSLLQHHNFGNEGFLWIADLGAPDRTFVLPLLAAVTTYVSSKIGMPQNPDNPQSSMNLIMSAVIGWMALKFPSGLALYWVVSNLIQILQQVIIMRSTASVKEEVK